MNDLRIYQENQLIEVEGVECRIISVYTNILVVLHPKRETLVVRIRDLSIVEKEKEARRGKNTRKRKQQSSYPE